MEYFDEFTFDELTFEEVITRVPTDEEMKIMFMISLFSHCNLSAQTKHIFKRVFVGSICVEDITRVPTDEELITAINEISALPPTNITFYHKGKIETGNREKEEFDYCQNVQVERLKENKFQQGLKRQFDEALADSNHVNLKKGKRDRVTINYGREPIVRKKTRLGAFGIPDKMETIFHFKELHYLVKTGIDKGKICYGLKLDEVEPTDYYEMLPRAMTQYAQLHFGFDPKKHKLQSFASNLSLGIGYGLEDELQKHFGAAYDDAVNLLN